MRIWGWRVLLMAAELMSYVHSFSVMPHLMRLHALFWIPRSSRGQGMVNNRTFITPASLVTDCFGADPPSGWVPRPRNDKERVTNIEYSRITPFLKHPVLKTEIKKAGENLPGCYFLTSINPLSPHPHRLKPRYPFLNGRMR